MIDVKKLYFSYTDKPFVENVSFHVGKGEIFGFLGPSGAGKSTIQKVLTGLNTKYKGSVKVAGTEIRERTNRFYENIGVDFEFSTCYEKFTARQNLAYFASLYEKQPRSIDELLHMVGLENDGDKKVGDFSKGMRSRLNFIKALIHDPDILFLDEPTSGLDPTNNRLMKDIILAEKKRGKTVIITTHNMFDATELCDQVAFIVAGKVSALDSPHNLIMSRGAAKIQYTYYDKGEKTGECLLDRTTEDKLLKNLISENRLLSIHSSEPTLNDIFVDITGKKVLQVGAGNIALRRTESLLRFGADVTVTASEIRMEFLQLQQKYGRKRLELIRSPFMHGMTRGYELVLTATGDEKADLEVWEECKKHHIWVNVASDQALCDFRFPALVEEDDIVAGINSCNNDHGKVREVSAKIREILGTVDYNNVEE
mgnify:CR=1 FL=1